MDLLNYQDITGKRVKIINEDNDPVWGEVYQADYVKDKVSMLGVQDAGEMVNPKSKLITNKFTN